MGSSSFAREYIPGKDASSEAIVDDKPVPAIEQAGDDPRLPNPQPEIEGRVLREPSGAQAPENDASEPRTPPSTDTVPDLDSPRDLQNTPQPPIENEEAAGEASLPQPLSTSEPEESPADLPAPSTRIPSQMLPKALRDRMSASAESAQPQRETLQPTKPDNGEASPLEVIETPSRSTEDAAISPLPPRDQAAHRVIQEPVPLDHSPAPQSAFMTSPAWQPWWHPQVASSVLLTDPETATISLRQLMTLALRHSPLLEMIRLDELMHADESAGIAKWNLRCGCQNNSTCLSCGGDVHTFFVRCRSAGTEIAAAQTADALLKIATSYWQVYRLRGRVCIAERSLHRAIELQAACRRVDARSTTTLEVAAPTWAIQQRQAEVNAARHYLMKAQNELAFLVSVPAWHNNIELLPSDLPFNQLPSLDESHQMEHAISHRHEIQAALSNLHSQSVQQSELLNARATQDWELITDRVRLEVKNAIVKLHGGFTQMQLQRDAADKATQELNLLAAERSSHGADGTALLLQTQEKLQRAEERYLDAQVDLHVATFELRHATGTLLSATNDFQVDGR
ncbi:MAG: hypothetical protein R3C05_01575 [Pirellulaceae bacterium]